MTAVGPVGMTGAWTWAVALGESGRSVAAAGGVVCGAVRGVVWGVVWEGVWEVG